MMKYFIQHTTCTTYLEVVKFSVKLQCKAGAIALSVVSKLVYYLLRKLYMYN